MKAEKYTGRRVAASRAYWAKRLAEGPLTCYRCRKPVHSGHRWQVEHIVARALGGRLDRANEWVSHGTCNESHGAKLGAAMRAARRPATIARMESERVRGIRGW